MREAKPFIPESGMFSFAFTSGASWPSTSTSPWATSICRSAPNLAPIRMNSLQRHWTIACLPGWRIGPTHQHLWWWSSHPCWVAPRMERAWEKKPIHHPRLGNRSEFRGIPRLFQFRTFWTPEFSSEFYFSDRKMCSCQFWTRFFQFGILSRHRLFRFHESENVPALNVSGEWHQILIYSTHQLFSRAPSPSHCSWYLLDTHKS